MAKSREEILECYKIRYEIFVCEQKLFSESDKDKNDKDSVHILAKRNGEAVGTVRIFMKKNNIWFGGRLAVLKKARRGDASKLLVKKAVEIAKIKKAKRFLAWIQVANVNFFLRLGWKKIGNKKDYLGKPHQLMETNLS
ncbi:MAG: hypothetical protein A2149_01280 [Candidatus Schekmanbacteria bacterium RBG_16_38_11]|uniref:N-acetyltransferase domain-containing protein n=2 Tax=Candidatus Schekmaniibacteriota TaxID=1817811 RepID=A0A1F7REQ7_9BACT|nr:MAG: hypothetical protein A2042_02120 [Candidatus Schekmanbacteria bacterium GWA2_38_11]OGL47613.1 MAG: hypothetical protein A2149_01280 [Candidatus Schekmanbacteria bacterium RBG_16_38_11]